MKDFKSNVDLKTEQSKHLQSKIDSIKEIVNDFQKRITFIGLKN